MINKIISLFLIFTLLINNSFAEPFVYYSDRKEANEKWSINPNHEPASGT